VKRFFDTAIWDKPWYRKMSPVYKVAWYYLTSKCDNVGVWIPDYEAADFFIGEQVNWDAFRASTNGNIEVLDNGKWWLADFVTFQYGELKDTNSPHRSYISLLKKQGLYKGYLRGSSTPKEKDTDKDKGKGKEKDKERAAEIDSIIAYFNEKTNGHVKKGTEAIRSKIRARLCDGYSASECKQAIAWCSWKWSDDEKMKEYIRIPTIFGAEKFPGYVDNFRREVPNE